MMSFDMEMEDYHEDMEFKSRPKNIFITGVSSGLGKALMDEYTSRGHKVYSITRDDINLENVEEVNMKLPNILHDVRELGVVILNAGMLGDIKTFDEWKYSELLKIMDVNVWSNKYILDYLFRNNIKVEQVVSISSGASQHTYKGWGGYSISKCALGMMMEVYSKEIEDTHFISLAPGLVDTKMQDYLCNDVDKDKFPMMNKFVRAREDGTSRKPSEVAKDVVDLIPTLVQLDNGSFIDLRDIK